MRIDEFIEIVRTELIPQGKIESISPRDPIVVRFIPKPWQILGTGNYAAVVAHPDYPVWVVKLYAPGRPGFEEEVEVYRRLGTHPAFSECFFAENNCLILKRLQGVTLYDCLCQGIRIPRQVIRDIDQALAYAQSRGLRPHDIHGRNVMLDPQGRGLVVDISDFLHEDPCYHWQRLKIVYHWVYLPIIAPLRLRIPYPLLNFVRKGYRFYSNWSEKRHRR